MSRGFPSAKEGERLEEKIWKPGFKSQYLKAMSSLALRGHFRLVRCQKTATEILAFIAMFFFCGIALAHDIGVSKTELHELSGNKYTLRVLTGALSEATFPAPKLPEGFWFTANPRGNQAGPWKFFEFRGERTLTAEDILRLPWRRDGVMINVVWADGSEVRGLFKNEAGIINLPMNELRAGSGPWWAASKRYLFLGFEHILEGFDHLLFVLALMILVRNGWMLVKTITAFTAAHSITLGLATFGYVKLPSGPVETVIALSIVFLCVEIVHAAQGRVSLTHRYPWIIAFAFGLLHGLGFAGALSEIGLARGEIPIALLFFNIGVELGQLTFVFAILMAVKTISMIGVCFPRRVELVPTYLIGALAMYWTLERSAAIVAL
ncbi:HupE/UreJ family protein [Roseibium album]|uniref:HupE/UreJ family protein n=1 Tax=Roseibium album TaxID=311410 RepID=UPI003BAF1A72